MVLACPTTYTTLCFCSLRSEQVQRKVAETRFISNLLLREHIMKLQFNLVLRLPLRLLAYFLSV